MSRNEMPSATGVRIAGDNYQFLHAWRACMEALYHRVINRSDNPTIAVGVEEPNVGIGDDVVRYRQKPPHSYTQVKYAVDHRTSVGLAYLDEERILRNLVATHKALTADGDPVEMRLATNRTHDPGDVLMKDRDGRDGRLLPRAGQGSSQSVRGKARAMWAAAADTDERTLLSFLDDFHFDIAYEVLRLREHTGLLMTANGLRADENAIDQGVGWVSRKVIAGIRRLTLVDIEQAVIDLDLRAGSPWSTVSIATVRHDDLSDQAVVSIDWVDRIAGDSDWKRVVPEPPNTWEDLAREIRGIPAALGSSRRAIATGFMRQATGFYLGSALRRVLGYEVGVRQLDQLWTSTAATDEYPVKVDKRSVGKGPDVALIVNVSANRAGKAIEWIEGEGALPVGSIVTATPEAGVGPGVIASPVAANSLAVALLDAARDHATTGNLHLFLIGPIGLAVLLGHHWNRVATTYVYEHVGGSEYTHAFTVEA
ncbi:SAVED domain-containing protein [Mycolicibacterium neoaurum]|uniref:SAVED domain-containing protein n=1 Tax=Mycolicibacterium neoaurum TaxID=1795 RepID=UPI001F4D2CDD|nr:SAVED domain-containing protein [Mycolicibacterium neoaurum]